MRCAMRVTSADVVLDQQHGGALAVELLDDGGERVGLVRIEAGGRLVEQQQARLGGERARDFEQALLAVGQQLGVLLGLARRGRRKRAVRAPWRARRSSWRRNQASRSSAAANAAFGREVEADLDVLGDRHALEQLHELEGAHQPHRGDLVLPQMGDVLAGEFDRSGRRAQGSPTPC